MGAAAEWSLSPQASVVRSGVGSPLTKKSTQPFLPGAGGVTTGYTVPALFLPATSQRRCASKRIAAPFATYAVRRRSDRITMGGNRTRVCLLKGGRTHPCATTAYNYVAA